MRTDNGWSSSDAASVGLCGRHDYLWALYVQKHKQVAWRYYARLSNAGGLLYKKVKAKGIERLWV